MSDTRIISKARLSLVMPRWQSDRLWFANRGPGKIRRQNSDGTREVIVRAAAPLFSFDFLLDGRMVVLRPVNGGFSDEGSSEIVRHADLSHFRPTGWNEIVVDGGGMFT